MDLWGGGGEVASCRRMPDVGAVVRSLLDTLITSVFVGRQWMAPLTLHLLPLPEIESHVRSWLCWGEASFVTDEFLFRLGLLRVFVKTPSGWFVSEVPLVDLRPNGAPVRYYAAKA